MKLSNNRYKNRGPTAQIAKLRAALKEKEHQLRTANATIIKLKAQAAEGADAASKLGQIRALKRERREGKGAAAYPRWFICGVVFPMLTVCPSPAVICATLAIFFNAFLPCICSL